MHITRLSSFCFASPSRTCLDFLYAFSSQCSMTFRPFSANSWKESAIIASCVFLAKTGRGSPFSCARWTLAMTASIAWAQHVEFLHIKHLLAKNTPNSPSSVVISGSAAVSFVRERNLLCIPGPMPPPSIFPSLSVAE